MGRLALELASLEKVSSVGLRGGPAHAVYGHPRPRLLLGEPLPGVTTLDGSPVYPEPPRLWLPDAVRWHVGIRPAAGGTFLVSREISQGGPADIWDGVPRPILGSFGITVRGPLGRGMHRTIFVAEGADFGPPDRVRIVELRAGPGTAPVVVTPPRPPGQGGVVRPRPSAQPRPLAQPLASGAEISSGQLTIRDAVQADGLAAALYLARAPWRAPVVVPVPADGVVTLPPSVREAGPLLVQLRAEDPWTVTNWPDWPGRAAYACAAPGIPASADTEEEALSRFLAGQRDLPVRPRRVASRLLAGPTYPDEDPIAVVMEAALAQCGPSLDAVLRGADDPHAQVGRFGPDAERMAADQAEALLGAERPPADQAEALLGAERPPAAVVPQPLLDADTRAVAAAQLFGALRTPQLARAAQDATSVVRSAERLVAASPYRRAVLQIAARRLPGGKGGWLALPAMSASLALVARISARGDEDCRSFERAWRTRWTDLARQAPDLTSIDLVLAEALIAATERARFA